MPGLYTSPGPPYVSNPLDVNTGKGLLRGVPQC
jgi:hypothetical protein